MKAIVHIGSPKAGSSSIQDFLHLNAARLAERGVRYRRNVSHRGSQFEYPLAVMARSGKLINGETERARYQARTVKEALAGNEKYLNDLSRYADRYKEPVAMFSSEHILPWLNSASLVKAFDDLFCANFDDVQYVVYFRSPDDALLSQYSERVKRGYSKPLEAFVRQRLKGLNILKTASRWANTVGDDRMQVRLFGQDLLDNGDVIEDFCNACGIDATELQKPPRVNESLSAPGAECLRILNSMLPELRPDGSSNPLRSELLEAVQALSADMPRLQLNDKQRKMINDLTREPLEAFHKRFFPERAHLFTTGRRAHPLTQAELREQALLITARLLIKTRMGELKTLNILERQRAYLIDPPAETTDTADATKAPASK